MHFCPNRFFFADYSSEDEEESVYETLSDSVCNISVNPPSDPDLMRPEDSNLSRIAEAAGRGIKKLRRNWSIKKDDLSKGLSKIKRSSRNLIEDVYTKEGMRRLYSIFFIFSFRVYLFSTNYVFGLWC